MKFVLRSDGGRDIPSEDIKASALATSLSRRRRDIKKSDDES